MDAPNTTKKPIGFGDRLRQLRRANSLTQERTASLLNVERSTYAKYETNVSMPQQDTLLRLAELFGVSVDYLLGNTATPTASNELRGDGTLPGLTQEETAMLTAFRRLSEEQRQTLMAVAHNYNALNAALKTVQD